MAGTPQDLAALRASETAVIRVNGEDFYNWESVWVQHRWTDPYPIFRFTCAEDVPAPSLWTKMQFEPGDEASIQLGGQLAITGVILVRQTAYDANNHGVMLQGVGMTWLAARASHVDKDGNFDNMTFIQIAERVLAPFRDHVWYNTVGNIPQKPFEHEQINAGEPIWDFFERLGRMIGIRIGSDEYGNFLFIGDHVGNSAGQLVEGQNILRCQAVISIEQWFNEIFVRSQQPASDDVNGAAASEQEARAPGLLRMYSPIVIPSEEPVTIDMLQLRAKNEAMWLGGTIFQVLITVQGWFIPDGSKLWAAGDLVEVDSPMALIVPSMVLAIQTVTFTQDRNQGTLTVLELVAPWLLNDLTDKNLGNPNAPQPPGDATINTDPATTPTPPPPKEPPPQE
jgi:prophage tail gpP-like protein